jgi:histidyl-tRNA synthetase
MSQKYVKIQNCNFRRSARLMKSIIQAVKGTRDFYPEDMAVRAYLLAKIRKVSEAYGFQEYEGPFLEKLELYAAKSGDELVNQQSYVLHDRGGEELTLRPELTPTLARMVAQRQNQLAFPLRWWSFGPFWRYERPQRGRTREFFQWNIDLIGSNSPEGDAELIAIACSFFKEVGLGAEKVRIALNSRRLMEAELTDLGISPELRQNVFHVIDRRDKLGAEEWEAFALSNGMTDEQFLGLRRLLSDPELWKKSEDLCRVFAVLERLGFNAYVEFDAAVIRGLNYYTGIVFEAQDRNGGRAIFGGGHYDNLVGDVGGDPLAGVGFAMGDVMISVLLQHYGLIPELKAQSAEVLVTVFDEEALLDAYSLSANLRQAGLKVAVYPEVTKLQKQLKYADRIGVRCVLIAGPDERAAGQVTVKNLQNRTQVTISRDEVAAFVLSSLAEVSAV